MQSASSAGSPGQSDAAQQGESPLDQRRDRGPTEREATPESPDSPTGVGPEAQGKDDTPSQSGDPRNPGAKDDPGRNRTDGSEPTHSTQAPGSLGSDSERWGDLPVRLQDVFRNQGSQDLPLQYRDWIDAYYRRLNEVR
jgi:hypothetical protein